ncbi:hypothetical protein Q9R08_04855 [Microbacterium sp. QXD-8]|uniref:Uncharacterized protein n=1 Tax=Microbacterium psychrotolerans TaxID=3068321 RepID=A0ABU0Z0H4_9MICO|nr:hypothetical protein [Microbacterium sp. QXD-8]MDQ7877301.1 hypothetical protein [Microbacterium sp. QXD-8]
MDMNQIFETLTNSAPLGAWLGFIAWLIKTLQLGHHVQRFLRSLECAVWERMLRSRGASDKELRRFIREFAIGGRGPSP